MYTLLHASEILAWAALNSDTVLQKLLLHLSRENKCIPKFTEGYVFLSQLQSILDYSDVIKLRSA